MRLTLRTLLAYLDDILEPSQAKEIGNKIQESSLATSLINRIREVMRRRRLTAPPVHGSAADIDANTVSEYLDNTLAPEGVADLEKVCLESDIHLAEVAACHQILTLVLGEPVEIAGDSRERMYALGPMKIGTPDGAAAGVKHLGSSGIKPPAPPVAAERPAVPASQQAAPKSFSDSIPEYLRPRPLWQRALPYGVLALILLVFGISVALDPTFRGLGLANKTGNDATSQLAANQQDSAPTDLGADTVPENAAESSDAASTTEMTLDPAKTTEPAIAAVPKVSGLTNLDPEPPDDVPEDTDLEMPAKPTIQIAKNADPSQNSPPKKYVSAKSKPAPATTPMETPEEEPAPDEVTVVPKAPPVLYTSSEQVLLRYDPKESAWLRMSPRSHMHPQDIVAVPEPFEAALSFGDDKHSLTLFGGTIASVLAPTAAGAFGLDLQRGRFLVRRADSQSAEAVTFALSVKGELWRVELLTPDTVCGVEVTLREPTRLEEDFGENTYSGGIYVAIGSVRIADAKQRVQVVEGPGWFPLTPEIRAAANEKGNAADAHALPSIPSWMAERKTSGAAGNFANLFKKEFKFDEPAEVSLTNIWKHRLPEISRLGVACLGLIGDDDNLIQALNQREHEEARIAAIAGLRAWVNLDPENRIKLKQDLAAHFHKDDVNAVYRLLWGFNKEDASDRKTSEQLVDWLDNDNLAIRELAFYHVFRLTGRKYEYRPNSPVQQRKASVGQWRKHVDKDGMLLPPPRKAASRKGDAGKVKI